MLKTSDTNWQQLQNVVKVDPILKRLRLSRVLILAGGGLWLLIMVVGAFYSLLTKQPFFNYGYLIFFFIYLLFMIPYLTLLLRFWERLEQRRQAAARGDQSLLAVEQPHPDANALPVPAVIGQPAPVTSELPLPTTFVQRPNWKVFLIFFGAIFLTLIIVAIVFLVYSSVLLPPLPHHRTLPPIAIILIAAFVAFFVLIYCGIIFGVLYFKARQQLTVTETGLIMLGFRKVHSVSWREARLFAIDGIFGAKRYPHPSIFELSSANEVIRWTWLRHSNLRVLFLARPALSKEEYDHQMEALFSLIVARTGLPLYDLRDKPVHS